MDNYTTTVRLLHSGRVLLDCIRGSDREAICRRHAKLVADMTGVVCGTQTRIDEPGRMLTTIFVHDKPLIEVTTS